MIEKFPLGLSLVRAKYNKIKIFNSKHVTALITLKNKLPKNLGSGYAAKCYIKNKNHTRLNTQNSPKRNSKYHIKILEPSA